jgi:hypothetical protein
MLFGLIFLTEMVGVDPAMRLPLGTGNAVIAAFGFYTAKSLKEAPG